MIKGIPYWGKETFEDMRRMEEIEDLPESS